MRDLLVLLSMLGGGFMLGVRFGRYYERKTENARKTEVMLDLRKAHEAPK